jgi:hypothetical protein
MPTYDDKRSALAQAKARIAEFERLVGRQQMDIVFFRKALRAFGAAGRARSFKAEQVNGRAFTDMAMLVARSIGSSPKSTTKSGCSPRSDTNRP